MRTKLVSILLVTLVVLSGCSALTDATESAEETPTATSGDSAAPLSTTVTFPNGGVTGEVAVVTVAVRNGDDGGADYDATLTADGETVASRSVTLAGGDSATLSLSHTFEEPGEYELSVANETTTITVYETFTEFTDASMAAVDTVRINETTRFDATLTAGGRTVDATSTDEATIRKNFDAETLYRNGTSTYSAAGTTETERVREWVVNGTRYSETVAEDGSTTYSREPADEFEDDDEDGAIGLLPYLRFEHTDEEYVIVIEADNDTDATELWTSLGDGDESLPASSVTRLYTEIRYDRQTGRITEQVFRVSGEGGEQFDSFDATFRQEYVTYGEPLSVEVPRTVRDEATQADDDAGGFLALSGRS